jgi:arginine transport system permease protein
MSMLIFLPQIAHGVFITLILMLSSLVLGLLLAVGLTMCSYADNYPLKKFVSLLVFFVRGTPLLVQIFLIYYGAGQFEWVRHSPLWLVLRDPMGCAIIAFSLNTACYTTIILQGAIKSVPSTEITACVALGMSKWLAFRRIIFPRAFQIAMPAYSNEVVMILKSTSLASTITLLDLMGVTQQLIQQQYASMGFYLFAGAIYLVLNMIISGVFRLIINYKSHLHYLKS